LKAQMEGRLKEVQVAINRTFEETPLRDFVKALA